MNFYKNYNYIKDTKVRHQLLWTKAMQAMSAKQAFSLEKMVKGKRKWQM